MNTKTETNTQSRAWQLTINNPQNSGMTHEKIKEITNAIPSRIYWCMCDEIGEQGTPHTHVYIKTRSPIKFTTLKNKFPTAHLVNAKGTAQENRDYIRKEGKHKDTEKKDTNLPHTFEEWGVLPKNQQGKRTDLEYMYSLVKEGFTDSEIIEECSDTAIKHVDKINKLRNIYLIDKFKEERRVYLKVNYITGKTGTGKSREILDEYGDRNVYRVTDYKHPFDSYQLESIMVFEEFRSSILMGDMLNYLDIYPVVLPARYTPKVACFHTVYVVSNWEFEQQYAEIQKEQDRKNDYEAWVRRFNGFVKEYYDIGKYKLYNTMQEYLNRKNGFQPIPQGTQTPFDKKKELPDYEQEKLPFDE